MDLLSGCHRLSLCSPDSGHLHSGAEWKRVCNMTRCLKLLDVFSLEEAGTYNGSQILSESKLKTKTKTRTTTTTRTSSLKRPTDCGTATEPQGKALLHYKELLPPGNASIMTSVLQSKTRKWKLHIRKTTEELKNQGPSHPVTKALGSAVYMFVCTRLLLYSVCMCLRAHMKWGRSQCWCHFSRDVTLLTVSLTGLELS